MPAGIAQVGSAVDGQRNMVSVVLITVEFMYSPSVLFIGDTDQFAAL